MDAAHKAESAGPDKGIEAWRKIVQANPTLRGPRRELQRVYHKAERWNALIELMKEEVEKLPDTTPEEKVALLYEMVDVYKTRLKLDTMVVNTYNAILALRPGEQRALDALAAQFEHMKRWPDLIGVLQKKAPTLSAGPEQIELYLRIAGLFQEKFSNVAEAIKAYEKVLELDAGNGTAIAYLKTNYEKRRDWEKLIGVHQKEIEQHLRRHLARRQVHRGGQARLGEAEEAVGLDRAVAEGARDQPDPPRGAGRAGEALRAREAVGQARRRHGDAGAAHR